MRQIFAGGKIPFSCSTLHASERFASLGVEREGALRLARRMSFRKIGLKCKHFIFDFTKT